MSILINLDSEFMPSNQQTSDFTTRLANPIMLTNDRVSTVDQRTATYEIALVKATFWYSVKNISAALNNNTITFKKGPAATPVTVTIPDGIYQVAQIWDAIKPAMIDDGFYQIVNNEYVYGFELRPNVSTQRVDFVTELYGPFMGGSVTFGNIALLLGWPANTTLNVQKAPQPAPNPPDITNGLDSFLLHCDVVSGNASFMAGQSSDVLASYSITNADGGPGSLISVTPQHLIYLPVNQRYQIDHVRFYITDQSGRKVDFGGERVTASLHLRRSASP